MTNIEKYTNLIIKHTYPQPVEAKYLDVTFSNWNLFNKQMKGAFNG